MCQGENLGITDRDQLASCWDQWLLATQSKGVAGLRRGQAATGKCGVTEEHCSSENNLSDPNSPTWLHSAPGEGEGELLVQMPVSLEMSICTIHSNIY